MKIYLPRPIFSRRFYLQTNASKLGLWAELFQFSDENERLTISFFYADMPHSEIIRSPNKNYSP